MKIQTIGIALALALPAGAQGIRKATWEMSTAEKAAYVDAVNAITQDLDHYGWHLIDLIADYHVTDNWAIHDQGAGNTFQFLTWHRMVVWEMEDALQSKNPSLSIPYLPTTSTALDESFMDIGNFPDITSARFTGLMDFVRHPSITVGEGPWYTMMDYEDVWTNMTDLLNSDLAGGGQGHQPVHTMLGGSGGLGGLGGAMSAGAAPLDPAFYLHHASIDRFWQIGEELHPGFTATDFSYYGVSTINRYDGYTSTLYRNPLPAVTAGDIVDSRTGLGVFYSDEATGTVKLNGGYEVTNNYRTVEKFVYPGPIEASGFTVPSGKSAYINSNAQIVLKSGFTSKGSLVLKVGGYDDNFPSSLAKKGKPEKAAPMAAVLPNVLGAVSRNANGLEVAFRLEAPAQVILEAFDPRGKKLNLAPFTVAASAGENSVRLPLVQGYNGPIYLRAKIDGKIHRKILTAM